MRKSLTELEGGIWGLLFEPVVKKVEEERKAKNENLTLKKKLKRVRKLDNYGKVQKERFYSNAWR